MKAITDADSMNAKYLAYWHKCMQEEDRKALVYLLKSKHGRYFLMRLFDLTKVNSEAFTGNSQTFYNEGRRSIGVSLLQDIINLGVEGVKLKQRAEREYVETQLKYRQEYLNILKEED